MPCLVYVKFHYDKQFGHVFVGMINKVNQMFPFSNHKKYLPEELMVIMTDEKDHVIEISRSVKEIIGLNSEFV